MNKLSEHDAELRQLNRNLNTETVCKRLCAVVPRLAGSAYVVGAWIWIETAERPTEGERHELKVLGFSWNGHRKCWQHPCGVFRAAKRSFNPKAYYGREKVTG